MLCGVLRAVPSASWGDRYSPRREPGGRAGAGAGQRVALQRACEVPAGGSASEARRSRKEVAFYEARGQAALSQSRAQQAFRRGPERGRQPLSRVLGCALSPEGSRRVSCPERVSPQVPGLEP